MWTDHVHCTSTLATSTHHVSLLFPDFLLIFHYLSINYHIRKCAQTMYTEPQHYQQVNIMSSFFFLTFADFVIIFALITILGSTHRPCKQYPNINTIIHIFFWFYHYFSSENAKLSIFGIFLAPFWSLDSSVILVTRLHQQYLYISMIV